ncbi:molecular chaperone GrpE [Halogranum gelatinilyticum]|uniref:Protein GrpE n=1 Tax=Halogranum gelatinilyticum TaxID=660521 RepID=A0A1G9W6R0_9EURY|nr:nucleotide exchange factor GrpE [Halogranum gelatinilyticum]SDM80218.1 molecular chaperone GrpE [Halogranum gelatinilyticum]
MTDETLDAEQADETPVDDEAERSADAVADAEQSPDAAEAAEVDIAGRVAEYDDELAAEVRELENHVTKLEAELAAREERIDELEGMVKRKQADFQNYKQRAKKKQAQIKERATEDFVERVVTVRDNLVRALDQDEGADIRPGVKSTLDEFDRILESENVEIIDPDLGAEVDPQRHEVMMRVDSDQPEGTVASVFQPGYEMADKVIRAAQITVSDGGE